MLRGYRGFLAALGLAAVVFLSLGVGAFFGALSAPHYGYQSKETAQGGTQNERANPSQFDRDRAGLPYFVERIASAPDPKNNDEREKRDLAAQEAAALWGFWILVVSAVGTATTMIGTGFLLWQIILTREAVKDTGDATRAMNRQNELADQAQRPWLEIEIEFDYLCRLDGGTILLACDVIMKNIGGTPAYSAIVEHVLSPAIRNPIFDFKIAAEAPPHDAWDPEAGEIILPHGGTARSQEIIYLEPDDPRHPFDDGVVPQFMITAFYKLPDGRSAQSSRWFTISRAEPEDGSPALIPWEIIDDGYTDGPMLVESYSYIRVT